MPSVNIWVYIFTSVMHVPQITYQPVAYPGFCTRVFWEHFFALQDSKKKLRPKNTNQRRMWTFTSYTRMGMGPSGWDEGRKFQLTYLLASVPAFCAVGCCLPASAATCACARAVELGCNRGNTRLPLGSWRWPMIVIGRTCSLFPEGLNPYAIVGRLILPFVPFGPVEQDSIVYIIYIRLFTKKHWHSKEYPFCCPAINPLPLKILREEPLKCQNKWRALWQCPLTLESVCSKL